LSKSIKNDITFEKKLHDEVPSGKNYIIKNIKGKDFVVVKNLEGQNKETLVNSILAYKLTEVPKICFNSLIEYGLPYFGI
jgi:transposase